MASELWALIRAKAVEPNRSHFGGKEPDDELEDWIIVDEAPPTDWALLPIAGVSCIIDYRKTSGETSQRLITCQRIDDHEGLLYLWAFCHSRGLARQFRIDRITAISDANTGEEYPSVAEFFAHFSADRHHASKPGWGLSVQGRADFVALLNALVFVARCDRQFHPLERETLEQIICSFWLRLEHPGDPDCMSIMAHVDRMAPDAETFWVAMHRCAKSTALLKILKMAARAVIEADGRIATEEFYWGSKIDEFSRELSVA